MRSTLTRPVLIIFCLGALAFAGIAIAQSKKKLSVELIVEGDYVLSMVDGGAPIINGAVAVQNSQIVAIGTLDEINGRYRAKNRIDGTDRVLMPGLVNGHTHAAMTLLRGIADDLALMDWLNNFIFPAEVQFVDATFVRVGTELACWEMIRGGTTAFVDMYYFPDAVAEAVERCGLRATIVPSVIEQKSPDAETGEQSLRQAIDFAKRWKGRNSRITPAIGAHSVYTVSPEWLSKVRDAAAAEKVPVGIHLEESKFEIDITREKYKQTPVELLDSMNFFDNPVIAAHVVYPSASDRIVLAAHSVGAIHNPTSNMKISSGIAPIPDLIESGVTVGLGTDGAASNNDLDMWEEIRLASFLQKVHTSNPEILPAYQVLQMATKSGAQAIGLGDSIGTLQIGKQADMIQVSIADLTFVPIYDIVSHLVYVADEHDVVTTIVDGQVLMKDGNVLTLNEAKLRKEAVAISGKIAAELKK